MLDVAAWTDRKQFEQEIQKAISSLKATPRLQTEEPIYYPGELEVIIRDEGLQTGIPIPLINL